LQFVLLFNLTLVIAGALGAGTVTRKVDPEVYMSTPEIISYYGYPAEEHWVTTEDGYILALHRIAGKRGEKGGSSGKPVAFLQHGLLDSSATWVLNLPEESFGFMLADAGFDVWLGNIRGNTYTTNHSTINVHSKEFWDFSFDEMAKFDLPCMLEYVMETTGQEDMGYFGHSQGTEIAFIEFSRNKELAKHIKLYGALAPVARITHVGGFFQALAVVEPEIEALFKLFGIHDFIPANWLIREIATLVCPIDDEITCSNILFLICGWDSKNLNSTRMPVYFSHTPAGTSVKNVVHWGQMIKAGTLQAYDYGSDKANMVHYNQTTPLKYDVSKLQVPTVLAAGGNDFLGDPRDVAWLEGQIESKYIIDNIFYDDYNHMDFVWGMSAPRMIYDGLISLLKKQMGINY